MKKLTIILFISLFLQSIFAADFDIRLFGDYGFKFDTQLNSSFGGNVALDFSPFYIRGRDRLFLGAAAGVTPCSATGIEDFLCGDFDLTLGYECTLLDRLSFSVEAFGGYWVTSETKVKENNDKNIPPSSGLLYGGRAAVYFNIFPELSSGAFISYKDYSSGSNSFIKNLEVGIALKYNFTKGLFSTSDIKMTESSVEPVFPIFYSRYDDHSFGKLTFINKEKNDITNVSVSVFIEKFMSTPSKCAEFDLVKRGETFSADLTAFLDETVLTSLMASTGVAQVTVSYKSLGKTIRYNESIDITTMGRNNMTWEDDRRAAAFVSPRDGSANFFANYVRSVVSPELRASVPENIQYAAAIFGALKAYGINYVIDPSSAFSDNSGTTQVDFLQFPYQTLLYHGGDCDDLSILNCALLEALGIETAFITCPGHIFIAFDSGVSVANAAKAGEHIIIANDKVWVPLEITLCQDSFALERSTAMREWKKYPKERLLIPLKDAWNEYKAVGIPDSNSKIEVPAKNKILNEFRKAF